MPSPISSPVRRFPSQRPPPPRLPRQRQHHLNHPTPPYPAFQTGRPPGQDLRSLSPGLSNLPGVPHVHRLSDRPGAHHTDPGPHRGAHLPPASSSRQETVPDRARHGDRRWETPRGRTGILPRRPRPEPRVRSHRARTHSRRRFRSELRGLTPEARQPHQRCPPKATLSYPPQPESHPLLPASATNLLHIPFLTTPSHLAPVLPVASGARRFLGLPFLLPFRLLLPLALLTLRSGVR